MPKRSLASPAALENKRTKTSNTRQLRLESFFHASTVTGDIYPPSTERVLDNLVERDSAQTAQNISFRSISEEKSQTLAAPLDIYDVDLFDDGETSIPSEGSKPYRRDTSSGPFRVMNFADVDPEIVIHSPLSLDSTTYSPDSQVWPSESAPYSFLAHTLATLSQTRSRIEIMNTLTNAFRTIICRHPPSLLPAMYLLSNSLSPPYLPTDLGLGSSAMSRSIQHVSGLTSSALKHLHNTTGDIGDVAFVAKSNLRTLMPHPPLLIINVYDALIKISNCKGQGAGKNKQKIVEKLLVSATGEEIRFLARTLAQNLRVGAVRTTVLAALARAMVLTAPPNPRAGSGVNSQFRTSLELPSAIQRLPTDTKIKVTDSAREKLHAEFARSESLIKRVYAKHPNYEHIVTALFEGGLDSLEDRVPLSIGIPLHPALGSPARSLGEIYDRLGDLPFSAEFKYDGQRAQIHASRQSNGEVLTKIFSRHLEDMTDKYPDVLAMVERIMKDQSDISSFIMDSEIVAIDTSTGELKSFQELSNRARKNVKAEDVRVRVCVFAFDLMYLDEEVLLGRPYRERKALLRSRFPPFVPEVVGISRFDHVQSCESEDGKVAVGDFWERAIESRCEGLVIKVLDTGDTTEGDPLRRGKSRRKPLPATYEPDKRTSTWLKLKKDYVTGLGDSLDLVPIGAWHGNGRKAQWWSPILLGLKDPESNRFVAVCKCMSGFTDPFYKSLTERYKWTEESETCSKQPIWEYDLGGFKPDIYFKPQEVWEIRGADITLSPVSVAARGLVSSTRGLSLRFPRFIKLRDDKSVDQASTPEFLANMWTTQQGTRRGGGDEGDLVDVDDNESVAGSEASE